MASPGVGGPALDLHEGISTPGVQEGREWSCPRWPDELRLRASTGELVWGRCKSTNQCAYCARLAAVENSELLALDALHGVAPLVWMVLTTPSTNPDQAAYYRSREKVQAALRRRWPDCELAWILEFTTGYGSGAGGERRPHWNAMLKYVPADAAEEVHDVLAKVWCPRQRAAPEAQFAGEIGEMGGLMKYLALHFQKESQSPPAGWTGHRFTKTRAYLWDETPRARDAARASLRYKRELWKLERLYDLAGVDVDPEDLHAQAVSAVDAAAAIDWELVRRAELPTSWGDDGRPATFSEEWFPVQQT